MPTAAWREQAIC